MMAAQASMALHRLRLDRQKQEKAEALRAARDELEERVQNRTAELKGANAQLRRQAKRLAALRDVDRALLSAESPHEIAAVAARRAQDIVSCERVSVSVIDWEARQVRVLTADQELDDGEAQDRLTGGTTVPLDSFFVPDPVRAGEATVLPDLDDVPLSGTAKTIRQKGIRSVLFLPMMAGDTLIGALKMGRSQPDAFTEENREVGQELADHLAIALRQTRLLGAVQAQREQLATLRDIDQAILAAESPEEIAAEALGRVRTIVPFESATVTVIDWDAERAHVLAALDNVLDAPTTLPLDEVYLSDDLRAGQTEVISVDAYEPVPEAQARMREMGLQSILCLPMVVEGEVIGVVHVGRTAADAFTDDDWQVGRELADHMAIAIRQSQLLEEVQQQRERLEERVQERTEELESFTYSVSHDLRTPLRAIDGYTRILKEEHADQLDDEGRRLLDTVYESTQTMGALIDDLLTLSRLGRREMHRVPIDVCALAQEAFAELERANPEATANLTFTCPSLPDAYADRSMIRQVLINLLSNALKFTQDEESPHIEIGAEDRGDEIVYFVRDNGVGFSMEYADKLFGVFERLHDDFEGTGVGLAVVDRIIRRHDGRVWGEGTEGEGATMYFTLPPSTPPDND
jgi:signal transduction histidine kinase